MVAFRSRGGCGKLEMPKGARKGKAEEESGKELVQSWELEGRKKEMWGAEVEGDNRVEKEVRVTISSHVEAWIQSLVAALFLFHLRLR